MDLSASSATSKKIKFTVSDMGNGSIEDLISLSLHVTEDKSKVVCKLVASYKPHPALEIIYTFDQEGDDTDTVNVRFLDEDSDSLDEDSLPGFFSNILERLGLLLISQKKLIVKMSSSKHNITTI